MAHFSAFVLHQNPRVLIHGTFVVLNIVGAEVGRVGAALGNEDGLVVGSRVGEKVLFSAAAKWRSSDVNVSFTNAIIEKMHVSLTTTQNLMSSTNYALNKWLVTFLRLFNS